MNYYPKNVGDYARDTAGLTQGQHGAYNLLMDAAYATENGIPADEAYGVSKAATPAERKNTDKVLAKYFELRDGRYHQKRIDEEVAAFQSKSGKASTAARKRWGKTVDNPAPDMPTDMRTHMPSQSERNADGDASAMPIQNPESRTPTTAFPVLETSGRAQPPAGEGKNPESHPVAEGRIAGLSALLAKARVSDVQTARPLMERWLSIATDTQITRAVNDACRSRGGQPYQASYLDPIIERIVAEERKAREAAERKLAATQETIATQRAVVPAPKPSDFPKVRTAVG